MSPEWISFLIILLLSNRRFMNIFFDVIGCRLNQSEVENLANIFRALGHQIVADATDADLAIINTCTVTTKAAADSRKKLRQAARLGAKRVVATGCWATLEPELALGLDGVTDVFSNDEKESIPIYVLGLSHDEISKLNLVREPLPGDRRRTRAFIKVQEGCDNYCTYCLTRIARGRSKSRTIGEIKADVLAALKGGAQELVLTGVQLGAWGRDFDSPMALRDLLRAILSLDGYERVRLSSIEPWDFDIELLDLWADQRLCRHFHIPLQSGEDQILRRMGRPITVGEYADLVSEIRFRIPEVAITTDVITGFPGETDESFAATKLFIESIGFSGGHVFTYSPRPGTAAIRMKEPVPSPLAKERNAVLRKTFLRLGKAYRSRFIGEILPVLWESNQPQADGNFLLYGLTDNYMRVFGRSADPLWNEITDIRLISEYSQRGVLLGEILPRKDVF